MIFAKCNTMILFGSAQFRSETESRLEAVFPVPCHGTGFFRVELGAELSGTNARKVTNTAKSTELKTEQNGTRNSSVEHSL